MASIGAEQKVLCAHIFFNFYSPHFSKKGGESAKKKEKEKAVNHKLEELNQKTFHESLQILQKIINTTA